MERKHVLMGMSKKRVPRQTHGFGSGITGNAAAPFFDAEEASADRTLRKTSLISSD